MLKHSNYLHPFQNYSILVLIKGCLRDHRLMDCTMIDIVLNVFSYRFRGTYKTAFTFASDWFLYQFFVFGWQSGLWDASCSVVCQFGNSRAVVTLYISVTGRLSLKENKAYSMKMPLFNCFLEKKNCNQ